MVEGADHIAAIRPALVSGVRPPVTRRFARQRNQSRDEHEELDGRPFTDEGRRESAGRLRNHDQLAPVSDRLEHGVCVLGQPCRVVVARQVRRHRVMTPATQLSLHQMPVPADVAGAMDEDEGGHLGALPVATVELAVGVGGETVEFGDRRVGQLGHDSGSDVFGSNTPFGQCTAGRAVVSVGDMAQVLNERELKITNRQREVVELIAEGL